MFASRQKTTVTTDSSGDGEALVDVRFGRVISIQYIKSGDDSFDDGVDFSVSTVIGAEDIWVEDDVNSSKTVRPRITANGTDGSALAAYEPITVSHDQILISVSNGGDSKTGTFVLVVG